MGEWVNGSLAAAGDDVVVALLEPQHGGIREFADPCQLDSIQAKLRFLASAGRLNAFRQ